MNKDNYYLSLLVITFFLILFGCSKSSSDMQTFIQQTKARKPKPLEPLPSFKQFAPAKYTANKLRNPFEPYIEAKVIAPAVIPIKGPGPDLNRPKEPLEKFPLDALKMVGTISRGKSKYALVKDPQGLIHRVAIGNYMGLNFGKIINITDTTIDINEWINQEGNYSQRTIVMHLST